MSFARVWNNEEGSLGNVWLPFRRQEWKSDSKMGGQQVCNDWNKLWQSLTSL